MLLLFLVRQLSLWPIPLPQIDLTLPSIQPWVFHLQSPTSPLTTAAPFSAQATRTISLDTSPLEFSPAVSIPATASENTLLLSSHSSYNIVTYYVPWFCGNSIWRKYHGECSLCIEYLYYDQFNWWHLISSDTSPSECRWSTKRITNESKQKDLPTKANKHMLKWSCVR